MMALCTICLGDHHAASCKRRSNRSPEEVRNAYARPAAARFQPRDGADKPADPFERLREEMRRRM